MAVLGTVAELAAVVAGGDELAGGPVVRGQVVEGVTKLATYFLATDPERILAQFLAVYFPTFLCEVIIGETVTALELLPVHPDPV